MGPKILRVIRSQINIVSVSQGTVTLQVDGGMHQVFKAGDSMTLSYEIDEKEFH